MMAVQNKKKPRLNAHQVSIIKFSSRLQFVPKGDWLQAIQTAETFNLRRRDSSAFPT